MTRPDLGTASPATRRTRPVPDRRPRARAVALTHPPLAWRRVERPVDAGATILDLALCLVLAAAVVGLLLLAL